ncbi:MAG: ParB/RepB/Spo0J family partition protein [Clostridiales bacterium]|nr:ParB/RepB/Spo0J family partition protein [Clostridiales bacterium]
MAGSKRGLGRGLDALLPSLQPQQGERPTEIAVDAIQPNPYQPRRHLDPAALEELAESIRQHGILQPIIVRPIEGGYQLVAGERRWRAARLANLATVPVLIRQLTDHQVAEIALIENLQRADLNPIETARAYQRLQQEFGLPAEEIARRVGKSRSAVANTLRLLSLDPEIQQHVEEGRLTEGHARALLAIPAGPLRLQAARQAMAEGWTVRQVEAFARRATEKGKPSHPPKGREPARAEPEETALLRRLRQRVQLPVRLRKGAKKSTIEIDYFGVDDLERLVALLESSQL